MFLQSFDHGYYLLVKSIQELRSKKDGVVTVGIGGPIGSGKSRYLPSLHDLCYSYVYTSCCSDFLTFTLSVCFTNFIVIEAWLKR